MSMTQSCSAHVVKVVASLPLYSLHMSAVQCSKTKKKKKYFLQKKKVVVQAVMRLDFISRSVNPHPMLPHCWSESRGES